MFFFFFWIFELSVHRNQYTRPINVLGMGFECILSKIEAAVIKYTMFVYRDWTLSTHSLLIKDFCNKHMAGM